MPAAVGMAAAAGMAAPAAPADAAVPGRVANCGCRACVAGRSTGAIPLRRRRCDNGLCCARCCGALLRHARQCRGSCWPSHASPYCLERSRWLPAPPHPCLTLRPPSPRPRSHPRRRPPPRRALGFVAAPVLLAARAVGKEDEAAGGVTERAGERCCSCAAFFWGAVCSSRRRQSQSASCRGACAPAFRAARGCAGSALPEPIRHASGERSW
eukprot:363781-Chlamydomonas_euryale.AAC.14